MPVFIKTNKLTRPAVYNVPAWTAKHNHWVHSAVITPTLVKPATLTSPSSQVTFSTSTDKITWSSEKTTTVINPGQHFRVRAYASSAPGGNRDVVIWLGGRTQVVKLTTAPLSSTTGFDCVGVSPGLNQVGYDTFTTTGVTSGYLWSSHEIYGGGGGYTPHIIASTADSAYYEFEVNGTTGGVFYLNLGTPPGPYCEVWDNRMRFTSYGLVNNSTNQSGRWGVGVVYSGGTWRRLIYRNGVQISSFTMETSLPGSDMGSHFFPHIRLSSVPAGVTFTVYNDARLQSYNPGLKTATCKYF